MAIDPFVTEAKWKSDGLTKRTAAEKLKFKKTGVSEAMRAYGAAAIKPWTRPYIEQKKETLKALKAVLAKCKTNHNVNVNFVKYIGEVEKGIAREVARLNAETDALTVQAMMSNTSGGPFVAFHEYLQKVAHDPEKLEFLLDVKNNRPVAELIAKYLANNDLNVSDPLRNGWMAAPGDAGKKGAVVAQVVKLISFDQLRKFQKYSQIVV